MYIPKQQALDQAQPASKPLEVTIDCNTSGAAYPGLPPGFQPPYRTNPDVQTIEAFIQVTWVLWFLFILLMVCRGLYAQCGANDDDNSDSESDVSESAWRGEDSSLPAPVVASKHRKRLKKLDQVAPAQSLQHWRAEKSVEHIQTFATVSLNLSCAICLDSLEENDQIRELRCGHVYHAKCLSLWVERGHHDCPLCKYDMLGLKKTMSKAQFSVSRSATRVNLNTVAIPERGEAAEDVVVRFQNQSEVEARSDRLTVPQIHINDDTDDGLVTDDDSDDD
ncbi:hypothetical protein A1O7_06156 [Cladophialophora yegresii CBS 114405]|uniref:RING-type domain-containing protein n=1 Tax=Cladophialophora yegresii CBS 114405 TaxID=1182544 RepID=W9VSK1_9EURO|nr:uncharacterized protein A1O7_06156 [Cladophialophora yegresii CBS 114405]EXJ58727.1 hypothetical protein A1O7_06156 [Cladophialophora yegresii CBS 114405]